MSRHVTDLTFGDSAAAERSRIDKERRAAKQEKHLAKVNAHRERQGKRPRRDKLAALDPLPTIQVPKIAGRQYMIVPYEHAREVRRLGATYDTDRRAWWVPDRVQLADFRHWLPPSHPLSFDYRREAARKRHQQDSPLEAGGG